MIRELASTFALLMTIMFSFAATAYADGGSCPTCPGAQGSSTAVSFCGQDLSERDRAELRKLEIDLAGLEKFKNMKDYDRKLREVLAGHLTKISPPAVVAAIAEMNARKAEKTIADMPKSSKLPAEFRRFNDEVARYVKNREAIFGGVRGVTEDMKRLDKAQADLFASIETSKLNSGAKTLLKKGALGALSSAYSYGSARALQNAENAAIGESLAKFTLGAAVTTEATIMAYLTLGLASGPMLIADRMNVVVSRYGSNYASKELTTRVLANSTAFGFSAGVASSGVKSIAKIVGYASINEGSAGFFCRLAQETHKMGPDAVKDALIAGIIGAPVGTGLGLVERFAAPTSIVMPFDIDSMSKAISALALFGSASAGKETVLDLDNSRRLAQQANAAEARGDLAAAKELGQASKKARVDATVHGIETAVLLGAVPAGKRYTPNVKYYDEVNLKPPVRGIQSRRPKELKVNLRATGHHIQEPISTPFAGALTSFGVVTEDPLLKYSPARPIKERKKVPQPTALVRTLVETKIRSDLLGGGRFMNYDDAQKASLVLIQIQTQLGCQATPFIRKTEGDMYIVTVAGDCPKAYVLDLQADGLRFGTIHYKLNGRSVSFAPGNSSAVWSDSGKPVTPVSLEE
ncbi:MAG: hypothetical protein A2X94_11155 [Bdellovibrionales bacterium GWB1_55_8]|nr:MAG: hypothetical protein A2X94_11155 [Bdellovibrionales bacterium GWB1_55_8]